MQATSALDAESEALVQEALERVEAGRTVLVIAHRLSTVKTAQQVAVIDGGVVAEQGTHQELLAKGEWKAAPAAISNAMCLRSTYLLADTAMQWHCRHKTCHNWRVGKYRDLPRCKIALTAVNWS